MKKTYTEQQKAAFKQEWKLRYKKQVSLVFIGGGLILIMSLIYLIDKMFPGLDQQTHLISILMGIGGLVFIIGLIAAILFSIKNFRCPACGAHMGELGFTVRYCPNCGVELDN